MATMMVRYSNKRLTGTMTSVVMCLAAIASAGAVDLDKRLEFDIAPQPTTSALLEFAQQAHVQVMSSTEQIKTRKSSGVNGEFSLAAALDMLLEGTGLRYLAAGDDTIMVTAISATDAWKRSTTINVAQAGDSSSTVDGTGKNTDEGSTINSDSRVEEIIVTAQKKIERLQDVPVPVTVLSASKLVTSNQTRIEDYYTRVPGLSLIYPEGATGPTIAIRGITSGGAFGVNPTVGTVIDDISYGSSNSAGDGAYAADVEPGELKSVEVLRGPQGTLYGASNIGGLLKYVTVDPSPDVLSGRLQAGTSFVDGGDDLGYTVRGSVNIPLSDTLAVRVGAFSRQDPGYVDNAQSGEKDVNSTDVTGGRLSALWRPSDAFSLKLGALVQDSKVNGIREVSVLPGFEDLQQNTLRKTGLYQRETQAYSAIMNAEIGGANVISASGYSTNEILRRNDLTSDFGGLANAYFGASSSAVDVVGNTEKFTQEVRVTFPVGERMEWLLGGFYTHERSSTDEDYFAAETSAGSKVGSLVVLYAPSKYVDYAGFTNLTFNFTERFDTQFGVRASRNTTSISFSRVGPVAPVFFCGLDQICEPGDLVVPESKSSETATTYLITPRFKLSSDLMVYARIASGYRPGGPLTACGVEGIPCQFDSDKTENYELGIKGSTFDGSLTYDASLYYIDWQKIQLPARSPSGTISYTGNAGQAKSQGVELSAAWRLAGGFSINGWFAWNKAELTQGFVPPNITLIGDKGDRLPYSSPLSGSLSIDREFNITSTMTGYAGASASYVDNRKDVFNSTGPRATYPSYTQVDLLAGVRYGSWSIDAFANNVGNKRGVLSASHFMPTSRVPTSYVYIQPRTIGLSLSRVF